MAVRILKEDGTRVVLKDGECAGCPNAAPAIDRLSIMFNLQFELQKHLGTWDKINKPKSDDGQESMRQQFANQMFLAMFEETVEVMRETAYKNPAYVPFGWKKGQALNQDAVLEEMVDLWHFMMNVCLAYKFTADDFYKAYCKKNGLNHERKENGY